MSSSHGDMDDLDADEFKNPTDSATVEEEEILANEESSKVVNLRVMVFAVLFAAALTVSLSIFFAMSGKETDEFEGQFEGQAIRVIESFKDIVGEKLSLIGSLGVTMASFAKSQNATWPFVTINDFAHRSAVVRKLSGALLTDILMFLEEEDRVAWNSYVPKNSGWIQEGRDYQKANGEVYWETPFDEAHSHDSTVSLKNDIFVPMWKWDETFSATVSNSSADAYYTPAWQAAPMLKQPWLNNDVRSFSDGYKKTFDLIRATKSAHMSPIETTDPGDLSHPSPYTNWFAQMLAVKTGDPSATYNGDPMSQVHIPILESYDGGKVVAVVNTVLNWASYFEDILPPNSKGVIIVLENVCSGNFSYHVTGKEVIYLGVGDFHNSDFDHLMMVGEFDDFLQVDDRFTFKLSQDLCPYNLRVFPSQELYDTYNTRMPLMLTLSVVAIFLFTAFMYILYDRLVERRQQIVMRQATATTAIVSSLFPKQVRDRIMRDADFAKDQNDNGFLSRNKRIKTFLEDGTELDLKPIADFFPHTTVMFADVQNFTAWSSTRDPTQVFILLQTIYQAFDIIAASMGVFKVETIGDSYMAVCGLPEATENHALIMARFAWKCLQKVRQLVKRLETTLGPDTGDLKMRIGLHSGPVTAGVLRGERSRFQLFGDTVNTAARMESTCVADRIQISTACARLLADGGREEWIRKREAEVSAKGKGLLQTFWLVPKRNSRGAFSSSGESTQDEIAEAEEKHERLVDWVVDLLLSHLKRIAGKNDGLGIKPAAPEELVYSNPPGKTCLDEVAEVILLPGFDKKAFALSQDTSDVEIDLTVVRQLRQLVTALASSYTDNPFHNFEHACHVTMSVDKFLARIASPDIEQSTGTDVETEVHQFTHGINSDPLTLLAIVFSALIHDSHHTGVSNMQLCKEDEAMAELYRSKSVAEQYSLDVCWAILMQDDYKELRARMFASRAELLRFRQIVVNVVLATDIFDKELNDLRKNRWEKAFSTTSELTKEEQGNLRATIVIEYIIQASDVSHTMQHWHVYRKWNAKLFSEMSHAFRHGRMGKDPAEFWYKGELGFFDNYIIPLTKKLKECNVFGVSSDECLNYATENRNEWETRGLELTAVMVAEAKAEAEEHLGFVVC